MKDETIKKLLEDAELEELLIKANERFEELSSDLDVDLFDILDEGISKVTEKPMFISRAFIGSDSDEGYAVEFIGHDGDLIVDSAYNIIKVGENNYISIRMIEKIREMAYMGYVLKQGKSNDKIKV